ncbi:MAG: PP2C family serine/threonine-protein phosphatase [Pseudomonadota bacterium]
MNLQYCSFTAIGGREENQDRVLMLQDSTQGVHLFAVADGVGGHPHGAEAAQACMAAITEYWQRANALPVAPDGIEQLVAHCQRSVRALAEPDADDHWPPQTTLALLVVSAKGVWSGHVGDSRILHYAETGLQARTLDHSVTEMKVQAGEINERQALRDPDLNLLTRALGSPVSPRPSLQQWYPASGDLIFLASDGAWSLLTDSDYRELLAASDLQYSVNAMLHAKLQRAALDHDNSTIVLVRF